MSNQVTGQLVKLNVKGPFAGKVDPKTGDAKPDFDVIDLTIQDEEGKETKVGLFTEVDAALDFQEGDTVHALFNSKTNGKFTNNTAVKVKKVTRTNTPKATKKEAEEVLGSNTVKVTTNHLSQSVSEVCKSTKPTLVSKDTSMEVSGLLQALVNTGHFTGTDGIKNTELKGSLKLLLRLKREVAEQLERTGTV